jgi:alanine racemase
VRSLRWIEIDAHALGHNVRQFHDLIGRRRRMLAVVKANAYGHGLVEAAAVFRGAGADWLGVNSLDEAAALRDAGNGSTILILGAIPLDGVAEAVARGFRFVAYNRETVRKASEAAKERSLPAFLHFKVETGTHRQGIPSRKIVAFVRDAVHCQGIVAEGLSSHFANIEDTADRRYPEGQLETFKTSLAGLEAAGIRIPIRHIACTAATILFPQTRFNLVRVGIGLYGLWPSKETYLSSLEQGRARLSLKPALSWKARVVQVKSLPKGGFIGYGCTYRTTRPTKLAVIPVGYYDGYPRDLSNASYVLVRGRRAPIRGRVAMNFFTADVTDIPGVRLEDEVTLIGRAGKETITADHLASLAGTISYEILSRINPLLPRIVR